MNDYITTKRPSWRMRLLGFLGVTDLPIKVNCWYCNQDSYLLPGSKDKEEDWQCNICENRNIRDENGEIVDTQPLMYNESLNRPVTAVRDTTQKFQSRTLCDSCQRNQALIYQIMSDYIRDESDPNYRYLVDTADDYKKSLHEKYPLCDDCKAKIDEIVAEQKGMLRQRRLNEKFNQSMVTKPPRKLSKFEYKLRGFMWVLLHSTTIVFLLYAYYYPPSCEDFSVLTVIKDSWQTLVESCERFLEYCKDVSSDTMVKALHAAFGYPFRLSSRIIRAAQELLSCLSGALSGDSVDTCHWSLSEHYLLLLITSLFSFTWMNWHPVASKTYIEETGRIKCWGFYKFTQRFLYILRLGLLLVFGYGDQQTVNIVTKVALALVSILLIISVPLVRVNPPVWPAEPVGEERITKNLRKTYSDLGNSVPSKAAKLRKENIDAARFTPRRSSLSDGEDISDEERLIRQKLKQRTKAEKADPKEEEQDKSDPHDKNDGEIESIVSRLYKIAFDKH